MTKRPYTLASLATTLSTLTVISGTLLASNIVSATDDTIVDDVNIIVPTACTLSGTGNTTHNATINPGTYQADIGTTTLKAICNDSNGFAIYAAGYTGSKVGDTNSNKLVGQNTNLTIPTGIGTSGDSQWAMKLATPSSPTPTYPITIASAPNTSGGADASFSAYHIVPNEYTKVAYRLEGTDAGTNATGSTLTTAYAVNIASTQAADTYSGQVIYTLVHPNNAPDPGKINLYDAVASMSKGKQTAADLQTAITVPTSTDRTEDTSNSGVYEYDPSVFGTASDASNANKIYYYRGVLENSPGTYGSNGSAVTYPNYVKLGNTCWRIVRTTGSGGVKMIYNGLYGATTAGSCANTQTNTQVATSAFNGTSSTFKQIVRVGYTYNSTYAVNTSKSGTIAQIFGSNSNPGANNTRSDIKTYIEDTWYTGTNGVSAYTNILESSAGYCNDRTMNTTSNWTTPLAESTTISTYSTSSQQEYYFGAYPRTRSTAQLPSLACGNKYSQIDRSIVDLYRYNGTNGAAGSTTANYLKYPAAFLTADEAALAGSGRSSSTTPYHTKSFLRSGSDFWLLSPNDRNSNGGAYEFLLGSGGILDLGYVGYVGGVRPAISLTSGTVASSGSGIATDPWVVDAP